MLVTGALVLWKYIFTLLETRFLGVHAAQQVLPPVQNQEIIRVYAATTTVCRSLWLSSQARHIVYRCHFCAGTRTFAHSCFHSFFHSPCGDCCQTSFHTCCWRHSPAVGCRWMWRTSTLQHTNRVSSATRNTFLTTLHNINLNISRPYTDAVLWWQNTQLYMKICEFITVSRLWTSYMFRSPFVTIFRDVFLYFCVCTLVLLYL
jgi:hypothetical protein